MNSPANGSAPATRRKSPGIAFIYALLSLIIPGLGQFAAGYHARGIGWFIWIALQLGIILFAFESSETLPYLLPIALIWLFHLYDAWATAAKAPLSLTIPVLITSAINIAAGLQITQVDVGALFLGAPNMQHILSGLFRPEVMDGFRLGFDNGRFVFNLGTPSATLITSLDGIVATIYMALVGTVLPIPITMVFSVLGARNLMAGSCVTMGIYNMSRAIMNLLRSIEVIIIAVMMTVAVGIGPFAGVLALAIHGIGAQGKLYSEAIEDIDPGPVEAISATGATWFQTVVYAVLPQFVPQFIAFTMYRWDINVRMATVIGLVGGGGIGYTLYQYINTLQWQKAGTAIWLIAIAVIVMDWASSAIREKYT